MLFGIPVTAVALLAAGRWGLALLLGVGWAVELSVVFIRRRQIRERTQHNRQRLQREGLCLRDPSDQEVPHDSWRPEWNMQGHPKVEWVPAEPPELRDDDVVLQWGWRAGPTAGRGGFAIYRRGRIVARATTWIS